VDRGSSAGQSLLGTGEGEIERDAGGMDGKEGGGQVFMVVEKSSEARLRAPCLMRRPLDRRTEIIVRQFLI
jgi:hypothetical protein